MVIIGAGVAGLTTAASMGIIVAKDILNRS